jgi:hypothetical protein
VALRALAVGLAPRSMWVPTAVGARLVARHTALRLEVVSAWVPRVGSVGAEIRRLSAPGPRAP